jgi:hypothetical protein
VTPCKHHAVNIMNKCIKVGGNPSRFPKKNLKWNWSEDHKVLAVIRFICVCKHVLYVIFINTGRLPQLLCPYLKQCLKRITFLKLDFLQQLFVLKCKFCRQNNILHLNRDLDAAINVDRISCYECTYKI